jgi:class 3 adenylate cyclase
MESGVAAGGQLPAATVTVLLARVDAPAGLGESQREAIAAGASRLGVIVADTIARRDGVRPEEYADGDSVVAVFPGPSDAVACALDLQRAPLAPLQLRMCLHTGEMRSPGGNGGLGPAAGRAARLLDLAYGGQALVSGTTCNLVADRLPDGAWLADLGSHRLADLGRAERVWQLCQPDVRVEFPALRSLDSFAHNLPVQLTSFIGREAELGEVRALLADNRLVTLTGAGGAGKTRLALQVAAGMLTEFPAGVWQVDLAPLADPALVSVAVARALGLPDQQGVPTMAMVTGFLAGGRALVVLDNCEHLLQACAVLAEDLLRACPGLVIVVTSREPVGVAGEATWRVPSLALAGDAIELFADRARRARPASRSPRRTLTRWRRSAAAWTGCRWRSNWRLPGCAPSRRRRSPPACTTGSGC